VITFYDVTKIYSEGKDAQVEALSDINLTIENGEFIFLVGPSGAGKSTLTKLIIREEVPTKGQILCNGKNIARLSNSEIPYYRRNIGYIFQDFRLLNSRTAYENVAFVAEAVEMKKEEIKKKVPELLAGIGLKPSEFNHYPHQLSGGQQQRLCIARAMINNPAMIIADEPTGDLDPRNARLVMGMLDAINKRGTTVLVATHDAAIVNAMKKRVIALNNGRIVSDVEHGGYTYERK